MWSPMGGLHKTYHDVGKADSYLGEYFGDVIKVDIVKVYGVDTAGRLEAPATIERIQRP